MVLKCNDNLHYKTPFKLEFRAVPKNLRFKNPSKIMSGGYKITLGDNVLSELGYPGTELEQVADYLNPGQIFHPSKILTVADSILSNTQDFYEDDSGKRSRMYPTLRFSDLDSVGLRFENSGKGTVYISVDPETNPARVAFDINSIPVVEHPLKDTVQELVGLYDSIADQYEIDKTSKDYEGNFVKVLKSRSLAC
ncbi:hypothetical protein GOV14_00080 [Candidatus Pacearchaeota archaeon]|nr:hypothetical protein [Candidatus Pacearchaeota archaeon]